MSGSTLQAVPSPADVVVDVVFVVLIIIIVIIYDIVVVVTTVVGVAWMGIRAGCGVVIITVVGVVSVEFMVTVVASRCGVGERDGRLEEERLIKGLLICKIGALLALC